MSSLDLTLAALADPTRRSVLELLRQSPLRASDIADAFWNLYTERQAIYVTVS